MLADPLSQYPDNLIGEYAERAGVSYPKAKRFLRTALLKDRKRFAGFFFKVRESSDYIYNWHHGVIHNFLDDVKSGIIKRGIINIPPGYSKTEEVIINFVTKELAEIGCRFLHVSFADSLVKTNSSQIKDVVESEEFQELWPTPLRTDTKSKSDWKTNDSHFQALPTGGQVTGRRAGKMHRGAFSGAMLIDDPLKPEDAYSEVKRENVNNRYNNTLRSRLALNDETPVVIIMQRVHENDLCGFLLKGGTKETWHHLVIPAHIPEDGPWCFTEYPKKWTHGKPYKYSWRAGPVWAFKQSEEDIMLLKESDPYTYSSQYDQRPVALGKGMFKSEWWSYHQGSGERGNTVRVKGADGEIHEIEIVDKRIYADTAQKTGEENDYTVFQCWGKGKDGRIYLLDQIRGKWEAQDLYTVALEFCDRFQYDFDSMLVPVSKRKVEDKSSGTGLIQYINSIRGAGYFEGIPREKDKVVRAVGCVTCFAKGQVVIPTFDNWVDDYKTEFHEFSPLMTHDHDDQIDPTLDACEDFLISPNGLYDNV